MTILRRLQDYLDSHHVHYEVLDHQEAYTAPEIAHTLHVSGEMFAKVVIVKADGRFVMVALPSNWQIDFKRVKEVLPDCELGAMPPLGNLYGVDVYVDQSLTEDEAIVFQAGTHVGAIKLRYEDFANLVHPKVAEFHQTTTKMAG